VPVDIDAGAFLAGVTAELASLKQKGEKEADRVAKDAARLAADRAPKRTGTLAASIHVRDTSDGAEVVVEADYGAYVEYGTSDTPSQPFLLPAVQEAGQTFGRGL